MNESGSLQNLNDILVAGPVPWWPPAPGWYVLTGAVLAALAFLAWRRWRRWRGDSYRRQAQAELEAIRAHGPAQRLPVLLKRTALSAWPRREVAALSGRDWHRFLDDSAQMNAFCNGVGESLDGLAYGAADEAESGRLFEAAESWIRLHRRPEEGG